MCFYVAPANSGGNNKSATNNNIYNFMSKDKTKEELKKEEDKKKKAAEVKKKEVVKKKKVDEKKKDEKKSVDKGANKLIGKKFNGSKIVSDENKKINGVRRVIVKNASATFVLTEEEYNKLKK